LKILGIARKGIQSKVFQCSEKVHLKKMNCILLIWGTCTMGQLALLYGGEWGQKNAFCGTADIVATVIPH